MGAKRPLDFGAASKDGTGLVMLPPVGERGNSRNQPEQGAGEVDPDGMLHALDVAVAVGIFVNVQLVRVDMSVLEGKKKKDGSTAAS